MAHEDGGPPAAAHEERLAEERIPAAADVAELDTTINQLRDLETQARNTIETLSNGGNESA